MANESAEDVAAVNDDVTYDFDAAWAEQTVAAPKIRVLGKVYELPASIPAKMILIAVRLTKTGKASDEVPAAEILEMLNVSLGEDNVRRLMDAGLGMDHMGDILDKIRDIYAERTGTATGKGSGKAPPKRRRGQ